MKIAAHQVASPVAYILNQSLKWGRYPQVWKEAKIEPLPKNAKNKLTVANIRHISIFPVLAKIMEKIVFNQIQCYFSENGLNTDLQHA